MFTTYKNIHELDTQFEVPILSDDPPSDSASTTEATQEAEDGKITNESPHHRRPHATEAYSLRQWLYDFNAPDSTPLIHAAYRSAVDDKIFVLCERAKATPVLEVLHNLHELAKSVFPTEALSLYSVKNALMLLFLISRNPLLITAPMLPSLAHMPLLQTLKMSFHLQAARISRWHRNGHAMDIRKQPIL